MLSTNPDESPRGMLANITVAKCSVLALIEYLPLASSFCVVVHVIFHFFI